MRFCTILFICVMMFSKIFCQNNDFSEQRRNHTEKAKVVTKQNNSSSDSLKKTVVRLNILSPGLTFEQELYWGNTIVADASVSILPLFDSLNNTYKVFVGTFQKYRKVVYTFYFPLKGIMNLTPQGY